MLNIIRTSAPTELVAGRSRLRQIVDQDKNQMTLAIVQAAAIKPEAVAAPLKTLSLFAVEPTSRDPANVDDLPIADFIKFQCE